MTVPEAMRLLALRTAASATMEEVSRALSDFGIDCVALKGTALTLDVYPADEGRPLTDVDVLVRPDTFGRACEALAVARFTKITDGAHALSRTLLGRASPLPVDLHGQLFSRALFDVSPEGLFARAVTVTSLDALVKRPHALDLIAHAIGHFAKTRPAPDARVLGRDITFSMARDELSPEDVASHLSSRGLARAACYALARVRTGEARAIEALLPPDRLAPSLVRFARATENAPLETVRSVASRHVLNRSIPRGVVSFGYHALDAITSRLSRRP